VAEVDGLPWEDRLGLARPAVGSALTGFFATVLTAWFNIQQNASQQDIAEQQRQYTTVQEYMDKMSDLILANRGGGLRNSKEESDLRMLARARTHTTLSALDGERKRAVVAFLYEAHLIEAPNAIVNMSGADLQDAQLEVNSYVGIDLHGSFLNDGPDKDPLGKEVGALLFDCDLRDANLLDADLTGADLRYTFLQDGPDEDRVGAVLKRANLTNADLTGANLANADLEGAFKVTKNGTEQTIPNEDLEEQAGSLEGATMPNGQKYEDWLKDREKRQQDE
jgi:uncharacterized protein YjbI with pentapeptide repeats